MVDHRSAMLITAGLAATLCGACRPGPDAAIRMMLERQSAAWNAGDIEGFMAAYWRSPRLTFASGDTITRGWESTLAGYRERYPTRASMGTLTFDDLRITGLGSSDALVVGRWRLHRDQPVGGVFSLVVRRLGRQWRIVHDHTSRAVP